MRVQKSMIHTLWYGLRIWAAAPCPQARQFIACSASSRLLLEREWPDELTMARSAPTQRYLGQLSDLVAEAQRPPRRTRNRTFPRPPNDLGEKPCPRCGPCLPPSEFRVKRSLCRGCENQKALDYRRTLRGSACLMLNNARRRGRIKGLPCSIERQDILQMLLHQQGRCAYSGVPMEILFPHSNWRMSLERMSNSSGYSRENCILVAAEFNSSDYSKHPGVRPEHVQGTAQWSVEKFQFVAAAWNSRVDVGTLEIDVNTAACDRQKTARGPHLLRKRCKALVANACKSARRKSHLCEITHTDILQKLLVQQGRCFYSGVPLQYMLPHHDWVMSLERLDNSVGYTVDNCVLIAVEFNTPDHSRQAVREASGSSQWSLAKVMHVWGRAGFREEQLPIESSLSPLLRCDATPVGL